MHEKVFYKITKYKASFYSQPNCLFIFIFIFYFIFRKLYKAPWGGAWGRGGDSPGGEKPTLRAHASAPSQTSAGGRARGAAPCPSSPEGLLGHFSGLDLTHASLGNHPSLRTSSEEEWGPPLPRPPLGQVPAHAQPLAGDVAAE